jgi:hypothetical protein
MRKTILILLTAFCRFLSAQPGYFESEHFNCDSASGDSHRFVVLMYSKTCADLNARSNEFVRGDGSRFQVVRNFYNGTEYTNLVSFSPSVYIDTDPQKSVSDYLARLPDAEVVFSGYFCEDFVTTLVDNTVQLASNCCTHNEPYSVPKRLTSVQPETLKPNDGTIRLTVPPPFGGRLHVVGDTITLDGVVHHLPVDQKHPKPKKRKLKFVRDR